MSFINDISNSVQSFLWGASQPQFDSNMPLFDRNMKVLDDLDPNVEKFINGIRDQFLKKEYDNFDQMVKTQTPQTLAQTLYHMIPFHYPLQESKVFVAIINRLLEIGYTPEQITDHPVFSSLPQGVKESGMDAKLIDKLIQFLKEKGFENAPIVEDPEAKETIENPKTEKQEMEGMTNNISTDEKYSVEAKIPDRDEEFIDQCETVLKNFENSPESVQEYKKLIDQANQDVSKLQWSLLCLCRASHDVQKSKEHNELVQYIFEINPNLPLNIGAEENITLLQSFLSQMISYKSVDTNPQLETLKLFLEKGVSPNLVSEIIPIHPIASAANTLKR